MPSVGRSCTCVDTVFRKGAQDELMQTWRLYQEFGDHEFVRPFSARARRPGHRIDKVTILYN